MCGDNLQPGGQLETPGLVLEKLIFLNYRTGKSKLSLSIRTYASTAGYKIQTILSGQLKKISPLVHCKPYVDIGFLYR